MPNFNQNNNRQKNKMNNQFNAVQVVDATGLACPLPLLKLKLGLNQLASGEVIQLLATDAGSQRDVVSFAKLAGHRLVNQQQQDGVFSYWLAKA